MLKAKEQCHYRCSLSFPVIRGNLGPIQLKLSQFYHKTIENFGNIMQANTETYAPPPLQPGYLNYFIWGNWSSFV